MPRRDKTHQAIRNALTKDGWHITDDPYRIHYDDVDVYADLRVTRNDSENGTRRALVIEIKTFGGDSSVHELEGALGQYNVYRAFLQQVAPDDEIYLAVSDLTYNSEFTRPAFQLIVQTYQVAIVVIDVVSEEVVRWIP